MSTPVTPATAHPVTPHTFAQRFSSTPRGARLARRLAALQLDRWGVAYGGDLADAATLIVAELAANAATHGRVPGRDFELRLTRVPGAVLRIEVSDARGESRPPLPEGLAEPTADDLSGRGLLLVSALADRWCVRDRVPVGKTVCAELDLRRRP